jgi:hypothetical protein
MFKEFTTRELLSLVEGIANEKYDGHLTLLKFTSHWKGMFGTPDLDTGEGREIIENLPKYSLLSRLLSAMLEQENEII